MPDELSINSGKGGLPRIRVAVPALMARVARASDGAQSTSPRGKARLLQGAELGQALRLSLVRKHVEHTITFLFDMIGDLFPLVLWNEKCVDCYFLSPSRPR
jgi:hypothetical protein